MKKQKGQTLLEILLAFSVSILALSATILGVITSLSNTQYTKNQGLANSYAQEGMAVVKKIRDSSWNKFSNFTMYDYTNNTKYCLGPNSTDLDKDSDKLVLPNANCWSQDPVGKIFSREITFEHNSTSCCPDNTQTCNISLRGSKATVIVSWSDSKCSFCHKVELITCFSNVDKKVAP